MIQRGKDHSGRGAQRSTPHMMQPNIQGQPAAWSAPPCRATMGAEIRHRMALLPGGATVPTMSMSAFGGKADIPDPLTNVR